MSESNSRVFTRQECEGRRGFVLAGRSTYLRVDLSAIWDNIQILKSRCHAKTEVMAVVKANAYGHGSVEVSLYLNKLGIRHFGVATPLEGKELRENGIQCFIQVFGNCVSEEIPVLYQYDLTPTAGTMDFLNDWAKEISQHGDVGGAGFERSVVIKVDTGMSRNGFQCDELHSVMQKCEELSIPVHSIMTHFCQAWTDHEFTQKQLDMFLEVALPYRDLGVKLHVASSPGILHRYGTDLDFVRPGIAMYGQTIDNSDETVEVFQSLGLRPALAWIARPSLVKCLQAGRAVGYDRTYTLPKAEYIATFRFGYADGYNRQFSNKGILTDEKGNKYTVVGRISMDAVTVQVTSDVTPDTVFYVIKDDYTSLNSSTGMAISLDTITYDVVTCLTRRMTRVFITSRES